ncbi:MAG: abortive infection protein [Burkholderiaceae bacterium]|nr:abortive infection protein [Burkholderiaceae bacterium]
MTRYNTKAGTARWGFWMTCVWFLVYLLITQALLSAVVLLGFAWQADLPLSIATVRHLADDTQLLIQISLVVNLLSLPLIALMVFSKKGSSWRDYMAWRRVSIWRVIGWCMLCLFTVYLTGVVHQLLGWPESDFMAKMALVGSPVVLILTVAVAAPIFEELVFRGFMYSGFERSLGAIPAVLLTSAIFAMMHFQYNHYELLHIFVLGLVLAWARMRTQSLWTPIAMHAVNNGLAIAAVLATS